MTMIFDPRLAHVTFEMGDEEFSFPVRDPEREEVQRWQMRNHEIIDILEDITLDDLTEYEADMIEFMVSTVKLFTYVPDEAVDQLTFDELVDVFTTTIDSIVD